MVVRMVVRRALASRTRPSTARCNRRDELSGTFPYHGCTRALLRRFYAEVGQALLCSRRVPGAFHVDWQLAKFTKRLDAQARGAPVVNPYSASHGALTIKDSTGCQFPTVPFLPSCGALITSESEFHSVMLRYPDPTHTFFPVSMRPALSMVRRYCFAVRENEPKVLWTLARYDWISYIVQRCAGRLIRKIDRADKNYLFDIGAQLMN